MRAARALRRSVSAILCRQWEGCYRVKSKTIKDEVLGKSRLRLLQRDSAFVGIVIHKGERVCEIHGDNAETLWTQLRNEVGKSNPSYFGFDGARKRFLDQFPGGFASSEYLQRERDEKLLASRLLCEIVPLARAARCSASECREIVRVVQKTLLLHPYEKMRVKDLLESPAGPAFVAGCASFAEGREAEALDGLNRSLKPLDCAKWTIVTYLPFLWRPDVHMFLKPMVSVQFAERVGHPFAMEYDAQLRLPVYSNFLKLVEATTFEISGLQPRDNIDVQGFIWVVNKYKDHA
jgi:hypothetical protein